MLYILIGFTFIILLFVLFYVRPLDESKIQKLANKRRYKNIAFYFSANNYECRPDMQFKKSLKSKGIFYEVDYSLFETPSKIAALLKYKKHEWIILAFEKSKQVNLLWVNKGIDNSSANIGISLTDVVSQTNRNSFTTALLFHNHPNPNPNRYRCTQPSEADLNTANRWAETLNPQGVNVIKYICERGRPYRYFLSPADSFYPIESFVKIIEEINGSSRFSNLKLHLENIFTRNRVKF